MLCHLSYVGGASTDFICYILNARFMPTIADLLEAARRRYPRLTPQQAAAEQAGGALLIDARTSEQRSRDGEIPGALVVDRTVFEWRLDPASPSRIPEATSH